LSHGASTAAGKGHQKAFEKIKGDDKQMRVGMTLSVVYPRRVVVVRSPSGTWEVVS